MGTFLRQVYFMELISCLQFYVACMDHDVAFISVAWLLCSQWSGVVFAIVYFGLLGTLMLLIVLCVLFCESDYGF